VVAANVDDQAEQYRRGREDGFVWACDFATPEEVCNLVENAAKPGLCGKFDPYWHGFVAGAEEVLDDAGPV
jgi:hypothetical protein